MIKQMTTDTHFIHKANIQYSSLTGELFAQNVIFPEEK